MTRPAVPDGWTETTEYGVAWDAMPAESGGGAGAIDRESARDAAWLAGVLKQTAGWEGVRVVTRTTLTSPWEAVPTRHPVADCKCVENCAEDPATECSLSGIPHVHPDTTGTGAFGPCPLHPDAPGDH